MTTGRINQVYWWTFVGRDENGTKRDDIFWCDKKGMLRFTEKNTQDNSLQKVQRAADRRKAKSLKAQAVGIAKTRAELNSMIGLLQKRTIHNVKRKKALEAQEDAEMRHSGKVLPMTLHPPTKGVPGS